MDFAPTDKVRTLTEQVSAFMDEHVFPDEERFYEQIAESGDPHHHPQLMEDLKAKARAAGLWNLFLPHGEHGAGLTNLEYAPLCEIMGKVAWAPEVFNCNAPDTGNMEVLAQYGTKSQQDRWLAPLLAGEIRSCFSMTEPAVASSDARNIRSSIVRDGDEYVINGRKWWTSNAGRHNCEISIFMGVSNPDADPYHQQSMILVPMDTPGITMVRNLTVFGYVDPEGHMEMSFEDVRVPAENLVGQENQGWTYAKFLLGNERTGIARIGATKVALAEVKKHATKTGLISDPFFAVRLAEAENDLLALELTQMRVASGSKDGQPNPASSVLKLRGSQLQQLTTELMMDVAGPDVLPFEAAAILSPQWAQASAPHYLNYRKTSIYGGSNEVQRTIIASTILGL